MIDNDALTKLHKIEKEVLDEFVRVCDKNKLTYFITGGTVLGAVRHKGFIPWDDDIDVGMPRADYEKFIALASKELGDSYYLLSQETNKSFRFCFSRVCKKNTFFIKKKMKNESEWEGIHIDVFPYDNTGSAKIAVFLQDFLFRRLQCIASAKIKKPRFPNHLIESFLSNFLSLKTIRKAQNKIITRYLNKNTDLFIQLTTGAGYKKETFRKDIFFPLIKIEFEGSFYNCPSGIDAYLTQMYGSSYMELPPENERAGSNPLVEIVFDAQGAADEK